MRIRTRHNPRAGRLIGTGISMFLVVLFAAGRFGHFNLAPVALAASLDDLRSKITDNNQKILELQKQIDQYSALYDTTSKQAVTLKNALAALEANGKKLESQLTLTATQITKTGLTLQELAQTIVTTETDIKKSSRAVSEGMRIMDEAESRSVIQELLNQKSLSESWDYVNGLRAVQGRIAADLSTLKDLRESLAAQKARAEKEKVDLIALQKSLTGQKLAVEANKGEKATLLTETQNSAAKYQNQLAAATAQKAQFEKELYEYESQLKIAIDPNSLPSEKPGILSWPLKNIYITQYFGYTAAAAKLYKTTGKHGGMDLRASIGTPVYAALSGVVTDTEGLKAKAGCQYGKFVLIRHANGLSTIYGHLSVVNVSAGDTVLTGDMIGYSGATGYVYPPGAQGAHLHFGVYATQGIRVVDSSNLSAGSSCKGIKTVAADPKAYLDPLSYLPKR